MMKTKKPLVFLAAALFLIFTVTGCGQNPASSSNDIFIISEGENYFNLSNGIRVYGPRNAAQAMADSINLLRQKYTKGYSAVSSNIKSVVFTNTGPRADAYAWVSPATYIDTIFFKSNYDPDSTYNAGVLVHETKHITNYKKYGSALSDVQDELDAYTEQRTSLQTMGARQELTSYLNDRIASLERGETTYTAPEYIYLREGDRS